MLKQEAAELEIQGRWDWYPELPRPLVILREQSSREVQQIVSANYTSASRTSVAFTLPPLIADGLLIELSQISELGGPEDAETLQLRLIDGPQLEGISPSWLDSRATEPLWVEILGQYFFKDAGLAPGG